MFGTLWETLVMEIEENAGDQHVLLFQECFQKAFPPWVFKTELCGKGSIQITVKTKYTWQYVDELLQTFSSLPKEKIVDLSKLKAFADNK